MPEKRLEKTGEGKLPFIYRLILKLPKPSLDLLPDISQGIFWAIIVPIFLLLEFFLTFILLVSFPFPINILLAGITPAIVFIIFVRVTLERLINLWNATVAQSGFEWNIEKVTQEYLDLLKKRKTEKNEKL